MFEEDAEAPLPAPQCIVNIEWDRGPPVDVMESNQDLSLSQGIQVVGDGVAHQQLSMPTARLLLFTVNIVWEHGLPVDVMVNNRGLLLLQDNLVAEDMLVHLLNSIRTARLQGKASITRKSQCAKDHYDNDKIDTKNQSDLMSFLVSRQTVKC